MAYWMAVSKASQLAVELVVLKVRQLVASMEDSKAVLSVGK